MWQLFPQGHFNFPHLLFLHRVPPLALLLVFHSILPLVALFDPILTLRVWGNRIWRTKMSTLFLACFLTELWIFVSTWARSASWLSAKFSPDACGQKAFMRMHMYPQMQHIGCRWGLTNANSCTKKKRWGAGGEFLLCVQAVSAETQAWRRWEDVSSYSRLCQFPTTEEICRVVLYRCARVQTHMSRHSAVWGNASDSMKNKNPPAHKNSLELILTCVTLDLANSRTDFIHPEENGVNSGKEPSQKLPLLWSAMRCCFLPLDAAKSFTM